ncbi:hypothetical protein AMAG_19549 [Allomyces macrogynus ATCC 38327]|uniref:Guanylate cyclase domain-containing protein n=1 Tax=Allomyces macrogynus (strain ATCC 38327) TaxID=578462 RepID=A0A0L0SWF9_ALLM3|nr:hypothetical protein AMAG_19549 [Allomyces macrogynus ATCC 38327]|eukprot:KNE66908.1 hypothetical protein AMAG_19549 [Allomyces macrogynus ATCC 38327]
MRDKDNQMRGACTGCKTCAEYLPDANGTPQCDDCRCAVTKHPVVDASVSSRRMSRKGSGSGLLPSASPVKSSSRSKSTSSVDSGKSASGSPTTPNSLAAFQAGHTSLEAAWSWSMLWTVPALKYLTVHGLLWVAATAALSWYTVTVHERQAYNRGWADVWYGYGAFGLAIGVAFSGMGFLGAKSTEKKAMALALFGVNVMTLATYVLVLLRLSPTIEGSQSNAVEPARYLEWLATGPVLIQVIADITQSPNNPTAVIAMNYLDRLAREKLELKVRLAKLASQPIPDDADAEAPETAADEAAPVPEHLAELTEELYQLRDERDALSEANAELATKLADALTTVDDFAARTAKSERKVAEFRHLQDSYKYQAQHITELSELVEKQRVWLNQLTDGEELPAVARPNRSADAAMRESNSSLISELERAWSQQQQAEPPKGFFGLLDSLRAFWLRVSTLVSWTLVPVSALAFHAELVSFTAAEAALAVLDIGAKVFLTLVLVNSTVEHAQNQKVDAITAIAEELETQVNNCDAILEKMMPASVLEQIKNGEATEAQEYESVTVFFSDITNFTVISSRTSTKDMMKTLNMLWLEYDAIAKKWGIYKVETIGDAYLGVAGAPDRVPDHAERAVNFALDIIDMIKSFKSATGESINIRIGLHSGPVTAGVLGDLNPHWCLVGDTVNTASRMESTSKAGHIHISEDTYKKIKDRFVTQPLDVMEVKGKGKMQTYWVLARK